MFNKYIFTILLAIISYFSILAQQSEYDITLESVEINGLGGIQSYAFGQHDNKWIILGGRLDGLHQRQPFAAFDANGNNNQLIVVDPINESVWKTSLEPLLTNIKEQLSSTNMQFVQEGNYLIVTGGYGYSPTNGDHITFPFITIIDVPNLITAIVNNQEISPYFRQLEYEQFAVTGGHIGKIENTFYLVGGHKFMGRYNPMGPSHGPGFFQEYTNEIRPFNVSISDEEITVEFLPFTHDEMNLRRRDYNLQPIISAGEEQLMAYSGVFQPTSDLPWLYPVLITKNSHEPLPNFTQYYNHYHCASIPIYDESKDEMTTIFFGGIAQFYQENGILVQDNDVPFVKTIAAITRFSDGTLKESVYPTEMPGYLGAGSEFILNEEIPSYNNGCLESESIQLDPTLIGYIYGGISSSAKNVFWINDGSQSIASKSIYKVYIHKKQSSSIEPISSDNIRRLLLYPNPTNNQLRIAIDMTESEDLEINIYNLSGKVVLKKNIKKSNVRSGKNIFTMELDKDQIQNTLLVNLRSKSINYTQKVIVNME